MYSSGYDMCSSEWVASQQERGVEMMHYYFRARHLFHYCLAPYALHRIAASSAHASPAMQAGKSDAGLPQALLDRRSAMESRQRAS